MDAKMVKYLSSGMKTVKLGEPISCAFNDYEHPASVQTWNEEGTEFPTNASTIGFNFSGDATLLCGETSYQVGAGMYFSLPSGGAIRGGTGFACSRPGIKGMFSLGGPIEKIGRLKYIDGCSDTVLMSPTVMGDPCLNFLYIPPGIDQTAHTHPSLRIGVIIEGAGYCLADDRQIVLLPGHLFILHPDEIHSFHTDKQSLRLVIFHPDSDCGPSHDNHPMVNRTIVNGVSANDIDSIRTQDNFAAVYAANTFVE